MVLEVVLGLEVTGDSGFGVPDESNLEGDTGRRGGLHVERGAINGEILAKKVVGGLSEILKRKNASEVRRRWYGLQYLPRGWDWLRESHLDLVVRRKGHVRSRRRLLFSALGWQQETFARFTPRFGRTPTRWSSTYPHKSCKFSSRVNPKLISS